MTTFKDDLMKVWQDYCQQDIEPKVDGATMPALLINPDTRGYKARPVIRHDTHDEAHESRVTAHETLDHILYDGGFDGDSEGQMRSSIWVPPDEYHIDVVGEDITARLPRHDEHGTQIAGVDDLTILDDAQERHEARVKRYESVHEAFDTDDAYQEWDSMLYILEDDHTDAFDDAHEQMLSGDLTPIQPLDASPNNLPGDVQRDLYFLANAAEHMVIEGDQDPVWTTYITERVNALTGREPWEPDDRTFYIPTEAPDGPIGGTT